MQKGAQHDEVLYSFFNFSVLFKNIASFVCVLYFMVIYPSPLLPGCHNLLFALLEQLLLVIPVK